MRTAFRLVARLGPAPRSYPWILADAPNWVLRLGPGDDDRFYSNLPSRIEEMTAHWLRRRLGPVDCLQLLLQDHRAALAAWPVGHPPDLDKPGSCAFSVEPV